MVIRIRYFASLREQMGHAEEQLEIEHALTVAEIWNRLSGGDVLPPHILIAINMEYVDETATVVEGDEIAFFPPVTGG